jgi:hypothetical protein
VTELQRLRKLFVKISAIWSVLILSNKALQTVIQKSTESFQRMDSNVCKWFNLSKTAKIIHPTVFGITYLFSFHISLTKTVTQDSITGDKDQTTTSVTDMTQNYYGCRSLRELGRDF